MSEPLKIIITCIFLRWIIYSKRFTGRKNKNPEKVNNRLGEFVKIRSFLVILYFICYIILPLCIFYTAPYKYEIDNDCAVIEKYNGNEFIITIPRSIDGYEVVEISDFSNNNVTNVTLSDGIKHIRYFAFMGCQSLREIHCNDGLVEIGSSAFYLCHELSDVFISESVTTIGYGAFEGCSDDLTIHGVSGSYAEIYAKENNLNFESI